jgi:sugar/nucleoside kinase (ribokinase family)
MADTRFDVLTIGNAIVDIIARAEDDFLIAQKMVKGSMTLIDTERAVSLYAAMGPAIEISGGSAGNTAAGVASFGGRCAYFGKVANDHLGGVFAHDIRAIGVTYQTAMLENAEPTARSMILVTPDGERTMNTYLGACTALSPADIDAEIVKGAAITYMEGYLWDPPKAKEAFRQAAAIAHAAGQLVAITLSDSFCVDRYRAEFLYLMRSGTVDIVFSNESELHALYETADFATALNALRQDVKLATVTRSEKGSLAVRGAETVEVPAVAIEQLVDTTGAGDLYASGFLFGLARGEDLRICCELGCLAAAEVITHLGARPEKNLADLARQSGYMV